MTNDQAIKPSAELQTLHDDTLIVFLSDTHIGGSPGQEIFESPQDLTALLDDLAAQNGPVELVLGGDFFDLLRISSVPSGNNRASLTIERPEYQPLFAALRRFAGVENHRVLYLPGNHDAEVWWNHDIQKVLRHEGLVHDFVYSYTACFMSAPERIIYCEHGNQFDPSNIISDYDDRLDTASENPEYEPAISVPHKFQIGMGFAEPGNGPAYHTHDYVEMFLILKGKWRFYWGNDSDPAKAEGEVILRKWDMITLPPGLYRGFEVAGKKVGWFFAVLDPHPVFRGKDPIWSPQIESQAMEHGFHADAFGKMVKPDNYVAMRDALRQKLEATQPKVFSSHSHGDDGVR